MCYTASIADEDALLEYQEKKCTRPENDATGDYLLVREVRNCTDPDRVRNVLIFNHEQNRHRFSPYMFYPDFNPEYLNEPISIVCRTTILF